LAVHRNRRPLKAIPRTFVITLVLHHFSRCSAIHSCQYCEESFYGDEDLWKHMHDKHETCHLCRKAGVPSLFFSHFFTFSKSHHQLHPYFYFISIIIITDAESQYYENYDALEVHFSEKYFLFLCFMLK